MRISHPFTHKDGIYCFIGPESYEVDEVMLGCAINMRGLYSTIGLANSRYLRRGTYPLFGHNNHPVDRGLIIEVAMEQGHPAIAVFVPPEEPMTFADGADKIEALREAKKIAKPTPAEGWTQIYRYTPSTGMVLVWDALTGNKSDKLLWEKE